MLIFTILQVILLFWFGYWLIISLFGFGKARKLKHKEPEKRFIILIPAHNEETVIGDLVANLNQMKYPVELYDVCVIADNSNDRTAEIGRALGDIVLEHTSLLGEEKGKPYAIKYALEQLDMTKYDAVCIFDADNLVTLNYLQLMNDHLCSGEKLIQCYLDSKNPNDNAISMGYAVAYYYINRSWQLAKYRLGLGNAIGGTGFCVDTKLLKEVGWTARSLTEDLEFTMQCLLKGVKATWCHHARVYDEKPTNLKASCIQRLRWARGHWDVCFKYSLPLLKRAITKLDINSFDGFLYLVNPGKIIVGSTFSFVFYSAYLTKWYIIDPLIPMWVWIIFIGFSISYIILTLKDSNKDINKLEAVISFFLMNYIYVPLFFWSLVTSGSRVWVRTEHKRSASIEDMTKTIGGN